MAAEEEEEEEDEEEADDEEEEEEEEAAAKEDVEALGVYTNILQPHAICRVEPHYSRLWVGLTHTHTITQPQTRTPSHIRVRLEVVESSEKAITCFPLLFTRFRARDIMHRANHNQQ